MGRSALWGLALLAVLAGACFPGAPAAPPAGRRADTASLRPLEQRIFEEVNRYRRSQGLAPLVANDVLTEIAREHSDNMARGAVPVGHEGFSKRFRLARAFLPIGSMSENVGTNFNYPEPAVPAQVVDGWIGSPPHRQNLSGEYELTGIGVARSAQGRYFATQIYAGR